MAQQLPLPLNATKDASPEEVSEWEKKDFFRASKFSAMVYFVVIPAIVQAVAFGSMLVIFYMVIAKLLTGVGAEVNDIQLTPSAVLMVAISLAFAFFGIVMLLMFTASLLI